MFWRHQEKALSQLHRNYPRVAVKCAGRPIPSQQRHIQISLGIAVDAITLDLAIQGRRFNPKELRGAFLLAAGASQNIRKRLE